MVVPVGGGDLVVRSHWKQVFGGQVLLWSLPKHTAFLPLGCCGSDLLYTAMLSCHDEPVPLKLSAEINPPSSGFLILHCEIPFYILYSAYKLAAFHTGNNLFLLETPFFHWVLWHYRLLVSLPSYCFLLLSCICLPFYFSHSFNITAARTFCVL